MKSINIKSIKQYKLKIIAALICFLILFFSRHSIVNQYQNAREHLNIATYEYTIEGKANDVFQKPFICLRLKGGLGNQMFQYAAAYALAQKHQVNLVLDKAQLDPKSDRPYQLDIFNVPQKIVKKEIHQSFLKKVQSLFNTVKILNYEEPFFHYDQNFQLLEIKDGVILNGFFVSGRYFKGVEKDLRELFKLKVPFSDIAKKWRDEIQTSKVPVALHVRRGDYLSEQNKAIHSGPDIHYYKRAMKLIEKMYGSDVEYFIFSDDYNYVKETFKDIKNVRFVKSDPKHPHEDMFLMSYCKHNIIANSTYSWWGAWLNKNPDKTVIAPYLFFGRVFMLKNCLADIYEDNWIILK